MIPRSNLLLSLTPAVDIIILAARGWSPPSETARIGLMTPATRHIAVVESPGSEPGSAARRIFRICAIRGTFKQKEGLIQCFKKSQIWP